LTPHSLRRTFASVLVALGRDPAVVMRQMGHTTPHLTLGVYAAAMEWGDGERERLRALVDGRFEVPSGRESAKSRGLPD
jgi:integrase